MTDASKPALRPPRFGTGLSARLLALTVIFVLLSEVLFFAPSIARYRITWLEQRLAESHLAILAQRATTHGTILDPQLEDQLLDMAGVYIVGLQTIDGRHLMLRGSNPAPIIDRAYDLDAHNFAMSLADAIDSLIRGQDRTIRVTGASPRARFAQVDIVLKEGPLRQALIQYGWQWLQSSVIVSLFAGALLYATLQWIAIRPMRLLTRRMIRFREDPEKEDPQDQPSARGDEIGLAERELAAMQARLRQALQEKTRLAALGTAVTKINHDLRGILATAQLITDRLVQSDDPQVRKSAPRLIGALDRAVALCSDTLSFARQSTPILRLETLSLNQLHNDVRDALDGQLSSEKEWLADFGGINEIVADRDQLARVLLNLSQNAFQMGARRVAIVARLGPGGGVSLDVKDDGPGLPPKALDNLFIPFKGSARAGGTGLGLAIAREAVRAHGGELRLLETGATGTIFRIELPSLRASAQIVPLHQEQTRN
ncbi:MAG TPA: HAMP domain-containing sensor histidine kinase [Dongiaceae bacterium]|jgi:signal transduction histidine kinase|nr:HAMP domain-containing sensor histidine kinase [Dongiaceae bacterium]